MIDQLKARSRAMQTPPESLNAAAKADPVKLHLRDCCRRTIADAYSDDSDVLELIDRLRRWLVPIEEEVKRQATKGA
jgi:hypothetical protein